MSDNHITDSIARQAAREMNEEFFDEHPFPFDIQRERISDNIIIYCDPLTVHKTWLVEITFPLTKLQISQCFKQLKNTVSRIQKLFEMHEVDVYHIRNKLFLRKLLF